MTTAKTAFLSMFLCTLALTAGASDLTPTAAGTTPASESAAAKMSRAILGEDWSAGARFATEVLGDEDASAKELLAAANNLCVTQTINGLFSKALAACNQSVALAPQRAGVYINRGNLYSQMHRPTLAMADYEHAKTLTTNTEVVDKNISSLWWKEAHTYVAMMPKQ